MRTSTDHRPDTRRFRILVVLITVILAVAAVPPALATTGSAGVEPADGSKDLTLPADATVLHVDDDASVFPDGSAELPFPTISWAVAYGQMLRRHGQAVHIIVHPGVYRETVTVGWAGDDPAPLVIESEVPGSATVTGADLESRWTSVDGSGVFAAPWDQTWGLAPIPSSWVGVRVPEGVRRREAVFVDGHALAQVLEGSELTPGSFMVDQAAGRLLMSPPAGVTSLDGHVVEVARRDAALRIKGLAHSVAVKGFVFESAAAAFEHYMAYVSDSTNVVIEGNTFRHSSAGGLGVCCTDGITVRDNRAVDNGGNGIDTYRAHDAVIEGNVISDNNARGARFGYTGWSAAGSKHLLLHDAVLRGNTYEHNYARGLWFDTDVVDVVVDGDRSCHNGRDGLFIEAVQGPLTVQHSVFCTNDGAGIAVGTSGNVLLARSILADNRDGQLVFVGDRTRSWTDHVTGARVTMGDFADWTLRDNWFASSGSAPLVSSPVISYADFDALLRAGEISASGDQWYRPSMAEAIVLRTDDYSMKDWRRYTGDR